MLVISQLLLFILQLELILVEVHSVELRISPENHLRPNSGSPFKIAVFADLHFGENAWTDWGPKQDLNSLRVMSNVLDAETPDFVVYLGDIVTANNIPIANASRYWDLATSPTRERGIPWASVFGNHDDAQFVWPMEWFSTTGIPPLNCSSTTSSCTGNASCWFTGTTRLDLIKHEIGCNALSMSQSGPTNLWPSVSNYVLNISSSENKQDSLAFMYFMDSGGGSYPEVISSAQSEWFKMKSEEVNPDSRVPEIIFWHIPSRAYGQVAPWFFLTKPCVGSINKEKVTPQEAELGMMKILENRPSVKAVIVGHDHGLDWCCPYMKMWLCYARHTGYGGYGNWDRGSRIVEINTESTLIRSWIRMEDGSKHSEVVLSS